jgi:hypothetical protein
MPRTKDVLVRQPATPTLPLRSRRRSPTSSRSPRALRRVLTPIVATASVLMALVASPAWAQDAISAPDVKVGDHWTYRILDGFTNELKSEYKRQVVSISSNEIVTSNTYKGKTTGSLMYFDRAWNTKDTGQDAYDPAFPYLRFPLRTGDAWTSEYDSQKLDSGSAWRCEASIRVVGPETLKLAGGSLDTILVASAHQCSGIGKTTTEYQFNAKVWYAPGQNAIARTEGFSWSYGRERARFVTELSLVPPAGSTPRWLRSLFSAD